MAQDEALANVRFLRCELKEDRRRNVSNMAWIYGTRAEEAWEIVTLKANINVAKKTI